MTSHLSFKHYIGPGPFSRYCLALSAAWLVLVVPLLNWLDPALLPGSLRPGSRIDVYQYYGGGLVVRHGIWDCLYPIPKPEVYNNPNHFEPEYKTFLYNRKAVERDIAFYPEFNSYRGSDWDPEVLKYLPEARGHWSYVYPPPTALFFYPLALVSFDHAAEIVWPAICTWSLFVLSFFASKIHRLIRRGDTYTEGLVVLGCLVFACLGQTSIPEGNISPVLAALIATSCWLLARQRLLAFSLTYTLLLLFKTIGLGWLPLLFINRIYRRTIVYLCALALLINGIVLGLAGTAVYLKFFSLASKIMIPVGWGIIPRQIHMFGFFPRWFYLAFNCFCLGFLYYGYWKKVLQKETKQGVDSEPVYLTALLAGCMSLFCLTNYIIWEPYCANYLFFPFLGWILSEGGASPGRWRYYIFGGTTLAFLILIFEGLWSLFVGSAEISAPIHAALRLSYVLLIPVFFLVIALRRLLFCRSE